MAAKPVDLDNSTLVTLADHASKLLQEFIDQDDPRQRQRMAELLVELEHTISEFRRLRPPPLFRKEPPTLRLVRICSICEVEIRDDRESFETPGAAYHVDCYERETRIPRRK